MPGALVDAAMLHQVSCVAGFQGECAEQEGAGGPESDDAEALPRGERQALHSDRGLGVQAGGQGADLVQVPGEGRVGDDVRGEREQVQHAEHQADGGCGVAYRRAVAEVRDAYPCAGVKPWPGRTSRPASAAPATASAEAVSTGAVSTVALANSQVSRRGIAASDSLIIPALYSLPMASTPATAATAWPG